MRVTLQFFIFLFKDILLFFVGIITFEPESK